MFFIMLLNNHPVSLVGPLNYICTQVNIIVETYILLNPKPKVKFYTRQNPKWFEKYIPNCILSFFYVPYNSITMNKFKKWATIGLFHPCISLGF